MYRNTLNKCLCYTLFAAEKLSSTVSPPTIQQPEGKLDDISFSYKLIPKFIWSNEQPQLIMGN